MNSGIYTITNQQTGMFYVGRTCNWRQRKSSHKCSLRGGYHVNPHLQHAFNKYGEDSFSFELIWEESPENLVELEGLILEELFGHSFLYNCHKSSEGGNLGATRSDEFKARISGSGNPMFGRTHTLDARKMQSEAAKKQAERRVESGWVMPQEVRDKHSAALTGIPKSTSHKRNHAMSQLGKLYDTPFGTFFTSKECEYMCGVKAATIMWRCKNNYLGLWGYTQLIKE